MTRWSARTCALALGIITLLPSATAGCSLVGMLAGGLGLWRPTQHSVSLQMALLLIVGIWSVLLGIFYAFHFLRNPHVPRERRTIMNALALVGNLYEMPRYWHKYIYIPARDTVDAEEGPLLGTSPLERRKNPKEKPKGQA
jgi:hypothetical protein